jgi:hypothetical protein
MAISPSVAHDYAGAVAHTGDPLKRSACTHGQRGSAHEREVAHAGEPTRAGVFLHKRPRVSR